MLEAGLVRGLAHITGGGITENLPRVLPEGCGAAIDTRAWPVPAVFRFLQQRGGVATDEMFRTFNMGIGMVVVCGARDAGRVVEIVGDARVIGQVVTGTRVVYEEA